MQQAQLSQTKAKWIEISKLISNFFNPLTSLTLYTVYYSFHHYDLADAVEDLLLTLFLLIFPIAGWIYWNVKRGAYSNMDVSNRRQRNTLYIFIVVVMLLYIGAKYYMNGVVDYSILFLFTLLVLMQISNFMIKSSMHTALNVFAAALFLSQDVLLGLIWGMIAIVVGITRVILKRHTVQEVLMGAFLAIFVSLAYLYTYIQSQV